MATFPPNRTLRQGEVRTSREWSVHPVWITGAPAREYAKVRPLEVALGVGRRLEIQRTGDTAWRRGRVVPAPDDRNGQGGGTVWITLDV